MTESYDYHLNFEALRKSTNELDFLLNKYRVENKYAEQVYQSLKPLFNKIHNNQLKKAIEGNLTAGRLMSDTGLDDQYPDLRRTYSNFSHDVHGRTDNPNNKRLEEIFNKIKAEVLAEKSLQDNQ